nr:hypothetical protein JVH1_2229 [Rhodococcus sp. JVH1]
MIDAADSDVADVPSAGRCLRQWYLQRAVPLIVSSSLL